MKYLFIVSLLLVTSGCAMWPEQGHGGWNEAFMREENGTESMWYTQSYANLRRDVEHLRLRLELLKARGIEQCLPAKLKLASLRLTRVTRELSANMHTDAEHDMEILYHQVNLLQDHFNTVKAQTGCGTHQYDYAATMDIRSAAEDLLNSDNQFAFTDDKITPKYLSRIEQAVSLLKMFKQVSILLIGHTDSVGDSQGNNDLGELRAQQVKRAIHETGLEHATITTVSKGESEPFADNTSLANRLSNRRVEAKIIDLEFDDFAPSSQKTSLPLTQWTHSIQWNKE